MTYDLHDDSAQSSLASQLDTFLRWLIGAASAGTLSMIGAGLLASSLSIALLALTTLNIVALAIVGRAQLARHRLARAVALTSTSLLLAVTGATILMPGILPILIVGTLLAVAVALPYATSRTLRGLCIAAWIVGVGITVIAVLVPPFEPIAPQITGLIVVVLMAIALPLLLLLLWQYHSRLALTLNQMQAANAALSMAMQEAEQARAAAEQARVAAEQVSELKTQFLANMSHELRTPLNSIINFTRILSSGMRGPVNESQLDYLNRVRMSGEHLLGLINDILDLSKIEAGRMELFPETFHIPDLVQSVMATAAGLTKGKPIELRQELAPDLPPIDADRTRIRQVLLNLLSNAAKFTDTGTITVRAVHVGDAIELSVIDTGIGIAPGHLEAIFEEFRQVDGETNRRYEGTGLGLAICRRLVDLHRGRLWVESTPGAGSTFTFTLPATAVASLAAPEVSLTPTNQGTPIVVIDDDPAAIEIVAAYLSNEGFAVHGVTDSRRALAELRVIRPAAVILDVLMPHRDGWELLADIKGDPLLRSTPVALYTILEEQKLGFYLGASAYLVKPVDAEQLRSTLLRLVKSDATILVIDDDPNAREIVSSQLEQSGSYRVITAEGGRRGLERVHELTPDLIILDLMMPEVDGFAVLEQLERSPQCSGIPVIVLTAKDLTLQEHEFLNSRVNSLLSKGATPPEQLLHKVTGLLGAGQPHSQAA
jgi:signal transduction histidine kinase/CheY-like chemotaxis protein